MVRKQNGFTIVELMIAISVFGVAMFLFTVAAIQIGRMYRQASVRADLNTIARELHEQIGQEIGYSSSVQTIAIPLAPVADSNDYNVLCFGNKAYFWGGTTGTNQYKLKYADVPVGSCPSTASGIAALAPKDVLPTSGRATKFELSPSGEFSTRFVVGELDMFVDDDFTKPCRSLVLGGQFCATVELNSVYTKKVGL